MVKSTGAKFTADRINFFGLKFHAIYFKLEIIEILATIARKIQKFCTIEIENVH